MNAWNTLFMSSLYRAKLRSKVVAIRTTVEKKRDKFDKKNKKKKANSKEKNDSNDDSIVVAADSDKSKHLMKSRHKKKPFIVPPD